MRATLLTDVRHALAEGPVWHEGRLWWVDIPQGRLWQRDPATADLASFDLGSSLGVALPAAHGWWWVAREQDCAWFHVPTRRLVPLDPPEPALPAAHRFNDGRCDPRGLPWIGTLTRDGAKAAATLYHTDTRGKLRPALSDVTLSNGLVWSPGGETFYYIDTPTRRIDAFDYDPVSGKLSRRRTLATFPAEDGMPDGMTADADGNLWIAFWGGWAVQQIDGRTGCRLERVDLPVAQVTSCTFGGPTGRTLFITTAREGLDESALAAQPHAGSIFQLETTVSGRAITLCALPPPAPPLAS